MDSVWGTVVQNQGLEWPLKSLGAWDVAWGPACCQEVPGRTGHMVSWAILWVIYEKDIHFREVTSHNFKELHIYVFFRSLRKFFETQFIFPLMWEQQNQTETFFLTYLPFIWGTCWPFYLCWNQNPFHLRSVLVQCYWASMWGCFPLCLLPPSVLTFLSTDEKPGTHELGPTASQPASVYWAPAGCMTSPWAPVWDADGPNILCSESWLPTVLQGCVGLGHSNSRQTGLANSNQKDELAWEFGILRGKERNKVLAARI